MNWRRGAAWLGAGLLGLGMSCAAHADRAIFATGCFWSTESDFEDLPGVRSATAGYIGGYASNPTYEQVGSGMTGHAEAVEVIYDPTRITYAQLLAHFWRTHDPFDGDGQFCDQGTMYRPAIFYLDPVQQAAALASREAMQQRFEGRPLLTHISRAERFWPAEQGHQDFRRRHPQRYDSYRAACRRDARLKEVWGERRP